MEDKDESEVESEHWGRNWIRVEKNKWFFWNGLFGKQAELREAGQKIYRANQRLEIESFNSGVCKNKVYILNILPIQEGRMVL